jgi:hypothetical protein
VAAVGAVLIAQEAENQSHAGVCFARLCGAYLKNNARRYGFRDAQNRLEPYVADMVRANRIALSRFRREIA